MRACVVAFVGLATAAHAAPSAVGKWTMSLSLQHRQFLSMEAYSDTTIAGNAQLELAADGTVTACIGSHVYEEGVVGHYQAIDHQDHRHLVETRRLVALRGRWTKTAHGVELAFDTASWRSCTLDKESFDPKLALHCTSGDPRLKTQLDALVCTAASDRVFGVGISLDKPPMTGPEPEAPVGSSLIVVRDPGAQVRVTLDPRAAAPTIELTAGARPMYETEYLDPPKRK